MYEKLTDRACKALQLANQEAQRFNHDHVGTEHILLGLIKEGMGNTSAVHSILKELGIDLRKVRLEVEKLVQTGPDVVTFGKLPQTLRAKKVIELAIEESRIRGNDYVGTTHLLYGILLEKEGMAAQILNKLGVTYEKVKEIEERLNPKLSQKTMNKIAFLNLQNLLNLQKEEAICSQDFERTMQLRDAVAALKNRTEPPKKEEVTDSHAEQTLNMITCNLLLHLVEKKSAAETLAEIHKIIHETV